MFKIRNYAIGTLVMALALGVVLLYLKIWSEDREAAFREAAKTGDLKEVQRLLARRQGLVRIA